MNFLLPPDVQQPATLALSDLEVQLQGPERQQVLAQTRAQLQQLVQQLQLRLQQGVPPADYPVLAASLDACQAALELVDSW